MKFDSNIKALEGNLNNPKRIMLLIGEMLRSRIQNAFNQQGRGQYRWAKPHTPNIMGILSDLERSSSVKKRRFDSGRDALKDTGTLLRSFGRGEHNIELPKDTSVKVGTPLPYAPTLNIGGIVEKKITPTIRKNLSVFLRKAKDKSKMLGWIFRKETVKSKIPARPFAILLPIDVRDAVAIIEGEFVKKV